MAIFCAILVGSIFIYFSQIKRRRRLVILGYIERIEKLKKRLKYASGDERIVIENQLRFLEHGYQQYLSEKKSLF
ncbi:MAG: hypothetical protein H7A36_00755 [Chlamydiales bacterium]|nr:hypothetical protein [Chlamydiales bacterium]